MKFSALLLIASLLTVACSPNSQPTPSEPALPKPTAKIAEPQRNALDKAKGVEATVQQSTDEAKQQLDKQAE